MNAVLQGCFYLSNKCFSSERDLVLPLLINFCNNWGIMQRSVSPFWLPSHSKSILGTSSFWRWWKNDYTSVILLLSIRILMKISVNMNMTFDFWEYSTFVDMIFSLVNLACKDMHWMSTWKLRYFMRLRVIRNLLILEWDYENIHRTLSEMFIKFYQIFKWMYKGDFSIHRIGPWILEIFFFFLISTICTGKWTLKDT